MKRRSVRWIMLTNVIFMFLVQSPTPPLMKRRSVRWIIAAAANPLLPHSRPLIKIEQVFSYWTTLTQPDLASNCNAQCAVCAVGFARIQKWKPLFSGHKCFLICVRCIHIQWRRRTRKWKGGLTWTMSMSIGHEGIGQWPLVIWRGSHDLRAQRARKTKSSRPKEPSTRSRSLQTSSYLNSDRGWTSEVGGKMPKWQFRPFLRFQNSWCM